MTTQHPPTDGTDEELKKIIEIKLLWLSHTLHDNEKQNLENCVSSLIHFHTEKVALEARIDTARKILHSGWCIPDMEVQVEDYINTLKQQQKGRSDAKQAN